jgi:hypothetical protein
MAIELVPLARVVLTLAEPIMIPNTPSGTRVIFEILESCWEGERFRAHQKGAVAADWLTVGPDGTGTLDVRMTLETHDGALVFVRYGGRVDSTRGLGGGPVYSAPQFETGDERYCWLNRVQAIAKGELRGNLVNYEVFEVR